MMDDHQLVVVELNEDYVQLLLNMHALHVEMPKKNFDFLYFYKKRNQRTTLINNHLGILAIASLRLGDKPCKIF